LERFSALQRAENSSTSESARSRVVLYNSFSALQRAENSSTRKWLLRSRRRTCFSALQRAENSSTRLQHLQRYSYPRFQCSSASRKFLNCTRRMCGLPSSFPVSVLFSEPKIPQLRRGIGCTQARFRFSALQRAENSSTRVTRRAADED